MQSLTVRTATGAALGLGVLALILALVTAGRGPGATVGAWILDAALLVLLVLTGRQVRRGGGRPGWSGAAVGAAYGAVSGLSVFFRTISAGAIRAALSHATHTAHTLTVSQTFHLVNSPGYRLVSWVSGLVILAVLGLVLGSVGGFFAPREGADRAV
jgi:hypothetical protein